MTDNMQQPIPQQQTAQQNSQSSTPQFTNFRYMGKEYKNQGTNKMGQPWTKYRITLLTLEGKDRHMTIFLPMKGKGIPMEQVVENTVYTVGYVDNSFASPTTGEIIPQKKIIGFYPERVDSNSLNPVSTNVPVQQQPIQQNVQQPVQPQQPLPVQQPQNTIPSPAAVVTQEQAKLDQAHQQLQQNMELAQFAEQYRTQFSPALFNEYHFIVTYMVMKNNNLTPLITQLKALFKSNVMGL